MSLSFLSECKEKVFGRMDALLPDTNKITSSMRYSTLADSKCIRAGLIFASGNLNKEISNSALIDMAASIELMHTYSLIHDDLPSMDNDDLRRGKPTVHIKWDEATAVLVGDALQAFAYQILSDKKTHPKSEVRLNLIKTLSEASGYNGMVLGSVVGIHIDDDVIDDGKVNLEKIKPLSRLGYLDYSVVDNIFEMHRPEGSPRPDQVKNRKDT